MTSKSTMNKEQKNKTSVKIERDGYDRVWNA